MTSIRHDWCWSATQTAVTKGVSLALFLWFARMMTPADLGSLAICAAFTAVFATAVLPNVGVVTTRRLVAGMPGLRGARRLAVGLAVLAAALAWPVGTLLGTVAGDDRLPPALVLSAAAVAVLAWTVLLEAGHRAEGSFRRIAIAACRASAVSTAAAVVIAVLVGPFWAALTQPLAFHALYGLLLHRPHRLPVPRHGLGEPAEQRAVLRDVAPLSAASLLWVVSTRGDDVAVAVLLGTAAAGAYAFCYRLVYAANDLLAATLNPVALRQFTRTTDPAESNALYLRLSGLVATLAGGLLLALALLADEVLTLAQPALPTDAALVLRVLCLLGWATCVSALDGPLLAARGRAGLVVRVQALRALLSLPLVLLAAPHGLVAVAAAVVGAEVATWPLRLRLLQRANGTAPRQVLRGLAAAAVRLLPGLLLAAGTHRLLAGAPALVDLALTGTVMVGWTALVVSAASPRRAARTPTPLTSH